MCPNYVHLQIKSRLKVKSNEDAGLFGLVQFLGYFQILLWIHWKSTDSLLIMDRNEISMNTKQVSRPAVLPRKLLVHEYNFPQKMSFINKDLDIMANVGVFSFGNLDYYMVWDIKINIKRFFDL